MLTLTLLHLMQKALKIGLAFLLLILLGVSAYAQKAISISKVVNGDNTISAGDINRVRNAVIVSDTLIGWNVNWIGSFKGAQAAYSNWSNGGVNTISLTSSSLFNAMYRSGRFAYALSTDLRYGLSYISGEGTRKINDKIAVNNKFSHLFGADSLWSAFANINFITQFDEGFDYGGEDPVLISEFMAPAYFTQIFGLGFLPTPALTFNAGLALKETFVLNDSLSTVYGLAPGDNFRFEPGFSIAIQFEKNIMENVKILTSLESFTNIKRPLDRTDLFFNAELIGSINDFLSMTFQFVAIYDDDFSEQLQIKQVLAAGLSFTLL